MIEFGHLTHAGLRRELNEDTYYGDAELGLWLVADGMGGHEYGEVASALARETIVREVRQGTPLAQAIRIADEEIIRASRRRHDALPMGTTVVAARVGAYEALIRDGRVNHPQIGVNASSVRNERVLGAQVRNVVAGSPAEKGGIVENDVVVKAFKNRGFDWGGSWKSLKDYQHFEAKKLP